MIGKSFYWRALGALMLPALGCSGPGVTADAATMVTLANPALITAKPSPESKEPRGQSPYVVISVLGFKPPYQGNVAMVVQLQRNGKQLGPPAGFFPSDTEFTAPTPSKAQRFRFELPKGELEKSVDQGVPLKIALQPLRGSGEGASIEIGEATIERR